MVALLAPPSPSVDTREVRANLDRLTGGIPEPIRAAIRKAFDSFFAQLRKHVFPGLLNPDPKLDAAQIAQLAGLSARDVTFTYFDLTEEVAKAIGREGDEIRDLLSGTDDPEADEQLLTRVEATFGPTVAENLARVGADLETMAPYIRASVPATPQDASVLMFGRLKPTFGGAVRAGFIRLAITSAALDTSIARRQDVIEHLARIAREDMLRGWTALRGWLHERSAYAEPAYVPDEGSDEIDLPPPDWSDL